MSNYKFQDEYPTEEMRFDSFNQYQDFTATTDKAGSDLNTILGLAGEVGEISEKIKKITRASFDTYPHGTNAVEFSTFSDDQKKELAKEVGDVLWYASRLADRLGYRLGDIACMNVQKLASRKERGVLHGKGDNR
jgi:NTP pyrophosphatase (non-canonical NTP hydrolase)